MRGYVILFLLGVAFFATGHIIGCTPDLTYQDKEFMFNHPNITFSVGNQQFDKYTPNAIYELYDFDNEVVTFYIDGKKTEIYLKEVFQKLPNTNFMVRSSWHHIYFREASTSAEAFTSNAN